MDGKFYSITGLTSIAFFVICMFWSYMFTDATLSQFHLHFMQITYPGFTMTLTGFAIGIVESFVYGFILGIIFKWLINLSTSKKI